MLLTQSCPHEGRSANPGIDVLEGPVEVVLVTDTLVEEEDGPPGKGQLPYSG